jgi:carotenoid cleavage dioxygenase-like enzyme
MAGTSTAHPRNTAPAAAPAAAAASPAPKALHRKGFETLAEEVVIDRLPVQGRIPDWLGGQLIRTGPARFEVGIDSYRHWFDGLAMLHAFTFDGGAVGYRNRFLRSRAYDAAMAAERIAYSEFATDPCRSIFRRFATIFDPSITDNANVNISRVAGHYVALTETPLPIEFDRATLETAGVYDFDGDRHTIHHTTAHPHHDPASGEFLNYFASFGPTSTYNVYRVPREGGRREVFGRRRVRQPAYIHSFGLTPSYLVLVEFPYVVNPLSLLLSGKPFIENFRWNPDRPARFMLFRRSDGKLVSEAEAPAFFAFHHVNAFEADGEVVVDICAYDDASVIRALYLDVLRSERPTGSASQLRRYHVPVGGGAARAEVLHDGRVELPRINYRHNGQPYQHAYFAAAPGAAGGFLDRLVKVDVEAGAALGWHEAGCFPGEAVFVASPGGNAEDDGVVLSVVLDGRAETSFLLVLDARTMAEVGRARAPHHIPFGFHGQYFS